MLVLLNMGSTAVELPDLPVLLRSGTEAAMPPVLHPEECAWLHLDDPAPTCP